MLETAWRFIVEAIDAAGRLLNTRAPGRFASACRRASVSFPFASAEPPLETPAPLEIPAGLGVSAVWAQSLQSGSQTAWRVRRSAGLWVLI